MKSTNAFSFGGLGSHVKPAIGSYPDSDHLAFPKQMESNVQSVLRFAGIGKFRKDASKQRVRAE
jgi:hypothetical protein